MIDGLKRRVEGADGVDIVSRGLADRTAEDLTRGSQDRQWLREIRTEITEQKLIPRRTRRGIQDLL